MKDALFVGPIVAISLLGFCLLGCSSSSPVPPEPKPKEIPTSVSKPSELTEEELIFRAKRYYEVGLYSEARENFEAIRSTFPLGPYGEFAEIKSADALFDTGAFGDAAKAYEELARDHPVSEALPYVLFRAGRSYQLSQRGIGRDMTALDRAQDKFSELLKRFPDSRHAWAAKEFLAAVMKDKADYAASIRDFYLHQGKNKAAEVRTSRLDEVLSPAAAAAQTQVTDVGLSEAKLKKLAALRVQAEREARVSAPNSSAGLTLAATSPLSTGTGASASGPATLIPASTYRIVKTACRAIDKQVQATVFLNKEITDRSWLQTIINQSGFKIPDTTAEADVAATRCGDTGLTLTVNTDGEVSLGNTAGLTTNEAVLTKTAEVAGDNGAQNILVTTLPNPPRLIILAAVQ